VAADRAAAKFVAARCDVTVTPTEQTTTVLASDGTTVLASDGTTVLATLFVQNQQNIPLAQVPLPVRLAPRRTRLVTSSA
jgi:hypothetical protein